MLTSSIKIQSLTTDPGQAARGLMNLFYPDIGAGMIECIGNLGLTDHKSTTMHITGFFGDDFTGFDKVKEAFEHVMKMSSAFVVREPINAPDLDRTRRVTRYDHLSTRLEITICGYDTPIQQLKLERDLNKIKLYLQHFNLFFKCVYIHNGKYKLSTVHLTELAFDEWPTQNTCRLICHDRDRASHCDYVDYNEQKRITPDSLMEYYHDMFKPLPVEHRHILASKTIVPIKIVLEDKDDTEIVEMFNSAKIAELHSWHDGAGSVRLVYEKEAEAEKFAFLVKGKKSDRLLSCVFVSHLALNERGIAFKIPVSAVYIEHQEQRDVTRIYSIVKEPVYDTGETHKKFNGEPIE